MCRAILILAVALAAVDGGVPAAQADAVDDQLQAIAAATQEWRAADARRTSEQLSQADVEILPRLLVAMDTDDIVAANWYRTAYETLIRKEFAKAAPQFPTQALKAFVRDTAHQGRSRRLVLGLLDRLEPNYRKTFIANCLNDPEFRGDAVDAVLADGDALREENKIDEAARAYETAFRAARDGDAIQKAAAKLKAIDREVSIVDHMGFVVDWYVLGPFDAPGTSGFAAVFPPETAVDLAARYEGQRGSEITWKRFRTADPMGQVNLVTAIAPVTEAVGYAYTEIDSPRDQEAQLRCGADDNLSVWVNGERVFAREQWLNGTRLDRFAAPVHLRSGKNRVLVKICQGPQHKNPAVTNNWSMQLRFCDADGGSVGVQSALLETEESPAQ